MLGLGFRDIVLWGTSPPTHTHTHSWGKGRTVVYAEIVRPYLHVAFLACSGKEQMLTIALVNICNKH